MTTKSDGGSGKKPKAGKKRLTKSSSDVDEPMKQVTQAEDEEDEVENHGLVKRGKGTGAPGNKKRHLIEESDEEDRGQPDVENRNNPNAPISNSVVPKGKRKVKKTRTYFNEKGYLVNEDYSSFEEGEAPEKLPPISQMVKKDPIKRVVQHNLTKETRTTGSKQSAAAATGKAQSSLSAFFKK